MTDNLIDWLTENDNPAIKYRTETELLNKQADKFEVKEWIFRKYQKIGMKSMGFGIAII